MLWFTKRYTRLNPTTDFGKLSAIWCNRIKLNHTLGHSTAPNSVAIPNSIRHTPLQYGKSAGAACTLCTFCSPFKHTALHWQIIFHYAVMKSKFVHSVERYRISFMQPVISPSFVEFHSFACRCRHRHRQLEWWRSERTNKQTNERTNEVDGMVEKWKQVRFVWLDCDTVQ